MIMCFTNIRGNLPATCQTPPRPFLSFLMTLEIRSESQTDTLGTVLAIGSSTSNESRYNSYMRQIKHKTEKMSRWTTRAGRWKTMEKRTKSKIDLQLNAWRNSRLRFYHLLPRMPILIDQLQTGIHWSPLSHPHASQQENTVGICSNLW